MQTDFPETAKEIKTKAKKIKKFKKGVDKRG